MSTLEELVYYCNEPEPEGAIMLTGEWGCGKTYLIENQLKPSLENTHIIIRISLFGVDSISTFRTLVKKEWIKKRYNIGQTLGKIKGLQKATSLITNLKPVKEFISINDLIDIVDIESEIDNDNKKKKVVLVFDDLERSTLNKVEILGCINEYVENMHIYVIIISNEDKISENKDEESLPYSEIKEKIVSRTVKLLPDFEGIINSIVTQKTWMGDEEYTLFLQENKDLLLRVFTETSSDEAEAKGYRSRNIRSLKCALQDFYRLYQKLKTEELPEIHRHLISFVIYTLAVKSGAEMKSKYGTLFADSAIKEAYPLYTEGLLFHSVKTWIIEGVWNEENINYEIERLKTVYVCPKAKDVLKMGNIYYLDEDVINEGFEGLLQDCYNGDMTLNEYGVFFEDLCNLRKIGMPLPCEVDWARFLEGVNKRIRSTEQGSHHVQCHMFSALRGDKLETLDAKEIEIYRLIEDSCDINKYILKKNRDEYIKNMQSIDCSLIYLCTDKRYNVFDVEMAVASIDNFRRCNNQEKCEFVCSFKQIWKSCDSYPEIKRDETLDGFMFFSDRIKELISEYSESKKHISLMYTNMLNVFVDEIVDKLKSKES